MKKRELSYELVLNKAISLANDMGIQSLSLAKIAQELNIKIPSLYNYFEGLPGLVYQLKLWSTQTLITCLSNAVIAKSGAEAISALCHAYRAFAKKHPGLYELIITAPKVHETEYADLSQRLLSILTSVIESTGVTNETVYHVIRYYRSVLHGFVDIEIRGGFGMSIDIEKSFALIIGTVPTYSVKL